MQKKYLLGNILMIIILFGAVFSTITTANSNKISEYQKNWFENNPYSLPIWMTDEELLRIDEIGKNFIGTAPPPEPIRQPAEFEPMEGVLIAYPFGISYQIIAEMSEDVEVVTVVANSADQTYVESQYQNNGVNLDHCSFLIAPSDSYWTRDYGPWFIINGDDEQGVIDHIYNRPRPNDDQIPLKYGNWRGIPVYGMSLEHAGGNYMTDGQGIAVSTDLVWTENPGYTHAQIDQMVEDYLGITTYHVVPDVLGDYIKHIDCWAKYLTPDVIMIIEVPQSHSQYDEIEEAVDYFEAQTSCYGTPYQVVRVYTHFGEPYINSLILNDKVFVPIKGSQWDDEAIASYEAALPGYEVIGFFPLPSKPWVTTDALHCRTMGITDSEMLYIEHIPLTGNYSSHTGYEIEAKIIPYSNENLVSESTGVYWKIEGGEWNFVATEHIGDDNYQAIIPAQEDNTEVYYYIQAVDESGRTENYPYIGAPMAYNYTAFSDNNPPEIISIDGPTEGKPGEDYTYCIQGIDTDEDQIYVFWDWDDGETSDWLGPYTSGDEICATHSWSDVGEYTIKVKIRDEFYAESDWTELNVTMTKFRLIQNYLLNLLLQKISEIFPNFAAFLKLNYN